MTCVSCETTCQKCKPQLERYERVVKIDGISVLVLYEKDGNIKESASILEIRLVDSNADIMPLMDDFIIERVFDVL